MKLRLNLEDISQICIGAFALAVPISFSEEAWRLGDSLPGFNLLLIVILSLIFIAFFAYQNVFQARVGGRVMPFVLRIIIAYVVTGFVVALVLFAIDKFPLSTDPLLAVKRLIIVSMPASMGAIVVDGLDKE